MTVKSKTVSEKKHLQKVSSLGCIACLKLGFKDTPSEVHHITTTTGLFGKASHFDTIPLCPFHHRLGRAGEAVHSGVKKWEEKFGSQKDLVKEVNFLLKL